MAGNINYQSSVALINGGDTIVFGTYTNEVYALNADDMSIQWIYTAENIVQSSVAVSPDGHIFFGDWNGVQYSIGGQNTTNEAIPTLSEWGMIVFMTILLGLGVLTILRRRMM